MTDEGNSLEPDEIATLQELLRESRTAIRQLNDQLRTLHRGGAVVVTRGLGAYGAQQVTTVLRAVADFDGFTDDNDPNCEHDCAVMEVDGIRIIWKIDYYDRTMTCLSPDATDPNVTRRVLTVMRADEY